MSGLNDPVNAPSSTGITQGRTKLSKTYAGIISQLLFFRPKNPHPITVKAIERLKKTDELLERLAESADNLKKWNVRLCMPTVRPVPSQGVATVEDLHERVRK